MSKFTATQNFSRRDVLKLFGATGGGLALGASGLGWSPMVMAQSLESRLNLFIAIGEDNKVYLTCHRSEMGQGIRTGIAQVLADELGADWDNVVVVQGLADKRYGSQNTDGSRSIRKGFDKMREMGAMARTMLEQAAAEKWQVAITQVSTSNNRVTHALSGKSASFGELALAASRLALPNAESLTLKSPKDYTHIGASHAIVDMQDMLTGKAQYGYDVQVEGMLCASITRPPVFGSEVLTFDDSAARKVAGVVDVIQLSATKGAPMFHPLGGVAVIATNSWSALEGRKALQIQWTDSKNDSHDSQVYLNMLKERVSQPGNLVRQQGDEVTDWPEDSTISALYSVPYLAHAPMEAPSATANVTQDACEVWASTQTPQSVQQNVAAALGLKEEQVKVNVTLLGGGFGRKSKPDYCVEAALLSKKAGKPIKVCWSREDEIQNGYLHAISAQFYQAKLGKDNMPEAILARSGFPSIGSTFSEGADHPAGWELDLGFVDVPLAVKSLRCEAVKAEAHTRIGWMRSVCNIQHAFGIGSFVDELAVQAKKPCTVMWKDLLGDIRQETFANQGFKYGNYGEDLARHPVDIGRYRGVIDAVEQAMKKAGAAASHQGWGFAVHRSFTAFVATALLVEVSKDKQLKVLKAISAIDAGTVVNPDRVKSQTEGAVMFGLSLAMMGEIDFKEGKVVQSNFHDYPMLRMPQCPEIEIIIIESDAPPAGVGEPGVPPVAPSLTNAIFAASGMRIRDLPVSKRLKV
ncbi:xanthine dehydrogenase family protein molybdopterin-binding subunit [Shewanella violacea]|uniref:Isoquinoline 1-oxidoreductase, beta subunit, putative n=1 Tax=Shewanella violacea (strain JCM 10179 / CIP 106290 / LMG 19151 / DSS12) TaxID=637905 RepID=D4ZM96_SHEVD|nr:molybdopterin cofactor-binding domain-containing protein [Shewanella violacea]BAJ02795.1 isoquinoline 1-oxidoreductase, beta subunit, putative [Shewanella violacea DSS12]